MALVSFGKFAEKLDLSKLEIQKFNMNGKILHDLV